MRNLKDYGRFAFRSVRLKGGPGRIANTLSYFFYSVLNRNAVSILGYYPISFGVFVTLRCNLACDFCYFDWQDKSILRDDITLEEFDKILKNPLFKKALRISLAGGEPLLHPRLLELVAMAYRNNLYTTIFSNGLLLNSLYKEIAQSKLNSIDVSLYEGVIEEQKKGLSLLTQWNKRLGNKMDVWVSKIISSDNYLQMEGVAGIAKGLGIKNIFFQNYYTSKPGEYHLSLRDDNEDYKKFIKDFAKRCKEKRLNVIFPYLLCSAPTVPARCISLYTTISVDRGGNISPCCFIAPPSGSYGNIFKDKDPWNTEFYAKLRGGLLGNKGKEHPRCRNCTLKNVKTFNEVKFS